MRKIVVSVATSFDGYIAQLDGSFDWLPAPSKDRDYGMSLFLQSIDAVIWGRKTYDIAATAGGGVFPNTKNYVFTHRPAAPERNVEFISEPVEDFAKRLRAAEGKDIWIMGGGEIIAAFLDAGEIDEFRIAKVPILIGEGIPLFSPKRRLIALELLESQSFPDGVVSLRYRVRR